MLHRHAPLRALEPSDVKGDRTFVRAESRDDLREGRRIQVHLRHLGKYWLFPRLVAEASAVAPVRARIRMELPVSPVGECPVAAQPPPARALEQSSKKIRTQGKRGSKAALAAAGSQGDAG